jgi:hypothetical protein
MLYKASSKSKLGEGKKWSYLGLVVYSSKEDSKGKPIRYKKLEIPFTIYTTLLKGSATL